MEGFCYNCFKKTGGYDVCMHCGYVNGTSNQPEYMLQPGMVLDNRYVVGTILGIGGFGVTYKAWDTRLGIIVAIKEFYPQTLASRVPGSTELFLFTGDKMDSFMNQKQRFIKEGKNLAKFANDPHVVNVLGTFSENSTAYIVMEYLDGVSLKEYLVQQGGSLSLDEASRIIDGVIRGVQSIHGLGIIHRDISPDNIYVLPSGSIKILDFGAARLEEYDEWAENIVVKKGYAPPEQYRANMEQSYYTDIYAIGATWYKLITGVTPEESVDRWEEDLLIRPSQMQTVQEIETLDVVDHVIMKSLALQPEDRYTTTQMMLDAIYNKEVKSVPVTEKKSYANIVWIPVVLLFICSILAFTTIPRNSSGTNSNSEGGDESTTVQEAVVEKEPQGIAAMEIESGDISLTIWTESNESGTYDDLVEAFEEQYPEYGVELIQIEDESELELLSEDELPTITRIPVDGFECADLTPVVESLDLENYYLLEQELEGTLLDGNGQIYFLPTGMQPYVWYTDTKDAEDAGIALPEVADSLELVGEINKDYLNGTRFSMSDLMKLEQVYAPGSYDVTSDTCELSLWEEDLRNYFVWVAECAESGIAKSQYSKVSSLPLFMDYGGLSNYKTVEYRSYYDGYLELIPVVYEGELQVELYRTMYVNGEAEENEQLIAMLFLAFMLSEEGQDILNVQAEYGTLPLLKTSVASYMNIYPETKVMESYLEQTLGIYPTAIPTTLYDTWIEVTESTDLSDYANAEEFADDTMDLFYSVNP